MNYLLDLEVKYLDTAILGATILASTDCTAGEMNPATGCTGCISAPAQGDGSQNRDGRKILIKSCQIQGSINYVKQDMQTTADTIPSVYVAMVLDTQTNVTPSNSEDVFSNLCASALCNSQPLRNMSYEDRFKILDDITFQLNTPGMANDSATTFVQTGFNVPFKLEWKGNIPVNFKVASTSANVTSVSDNNIFIVAYTTSTDLSPLMYANTRIRFVG